MGYYSDVALTLKKADAIELVRQAQENTYAKDLFNCVTSIHEDSDYVTFVWNCVKWYSQFDNVQFVTNFYQALGTYHFQRIGEDLRDIEEEWNDEDDDGKEDVIVLSDKLIYRGNDDDSFDEIKKEED